MSVAGAAATIVGTVQRRKAKKALQKELANAPKYKISDEAFENQALARSNLYGRDRAIQMGQQDISQSAADAADQARNISNSTSSLMSTVAQIGAAKNQQLRGLTGEEAAMRQQKLAGLQSVNQQLIDEKDKAWNYNFNMPFQMRVAALRDREKTGSEMEMAGVAAQAQSESAIISSVGSIFGGMMGGCDENIKRDINPIAAGLKEVMEMQPVDFYYTNSRYNDGKQHLGFIAQEIREIIPQAVKTLEGVQHDDGTPILMIDYKELVPVLVKAIQEQQKQINVMSNFIKHHIALHSEVE